MDQNTPTITAVPIAHTVPYVPLRDVIVYPHNEVVLTIGRNASKAAIEYAHKSDKLIVLFAQKDSKVDEPHESDLYSVGTLCRVERTLNTEGELNALVRGLTRVKLLNFIPGSIVSLVNVVELPEVIEVNPEVEALAKHLTEQFRISVGLGKSVEFMHFMRLVSGVSAEELADQVAATLNINISIKQNLLEELNLKKRLYTIIELLAREVKVLEIEKNIASKTQQKFSKSMREAVLRERINTIRQELGEIDELEAEHDGLYVELDKIELGKEARAKVTKELDRLDRMSPNNPEYNYIRTWLETIFELPWAKVTKDIASLKTAERILNEDHYGLEEVKERILEYLAVMKLKQKQLGTTSVALPTILCFVGPPGVGKTSLGRSIARSLRRKFVKVSLGGIRDEAEIRGHRKTYVGAMAGRIIEGIKTAKSSNPVFVLDEIDKLGSDYRGDPSAALLEALDPEQNKAFSDHYIELDYDLSKVMFIATANTLDTIPSALRDRLEVIRFAGYTPLEKFHIAKDYLLPKVLEKNALTPKDVSIPDSIMQNIIADYTREAGVRSLERELANIARKVARKISKTKVSKIYPISKENLHSYLGPAKFLPTLAEKKNPVGQATGLAWTSVGGEILFIEVATMPGSGKLQITGQLGDVMKESAQAAFTYIRSHYKDFDLKPDFYKKIDIHIHVPEGAVPKDGPSAGVTMVTALVSALTKKAVKRFVGMTGEVTLRGNVLEIGGLKEKVIAAHASGLKEIIIPAANFKDIEKIPDEVKKELAFHPVHKVAEVLSLALVY
ncbi:MAG: endopeptidase La [bacterium]